MRSVARHKGEFLLSLFVVAGLVGKNVDGYRDGKGSVGRRCIQLTNFNIWCQANRIADQATVVQPLDLYLVVSYFTV